MINTKLKILIKKRYQKLSTRINEIPANLLNHVVEIIVSILIEIYNLLLTTWICLEENKTWKIFLS